MAIGKRLYWVVALVAVLALAGAAVTVTSRLTSAGGSSPDACDQQEGPDDATEAKGTEADLDTVDDQCGDQNDAADPNEAEDGDTEGSDTQAPSGTLDDGKDLLPQAGITIDAAIAAAQSAASGAVGEVDLEQYNGKLVFNVDIGDKDVKVDASTGAVLSANADD